MADQMTQGRQVFCDDGQIALEGFGHGFVVLSDSAEFLYKTVKENKIALKSFISSSAIGWYGAGTSDEVFKEEADCAEDVLGSLSKAWESAADQFLDLGCSGGQLVIDYIDRGHLGIGLEGSNYSVINKRANWPKYHNKNLFT